MSKPVVISRERLEGLMFEAGVDIAKTPYGIAAANYALPSRAWIAGQFSDDWTSFRNQVYAGFETGDQVCQHYAQGAAWFAGIQNRDTAGRPKDCALAFGELWFVRDSGGGHAVNFAFAWEENKLQLIFFEPQTSQIIQLSKTELNQCVLFRV